MGVRAVGSGWLRRIQQTHGPWMDARVRCFFLSPENEKLPLWEAIVTSDKPTASDNAPKDRNSISNLEGTSLLRP